MMSETGWSNSEIFVKYLTEHFAKYAGITDNPNQPPTRVLFDGHRSHVSLTLVDWAKAHNAILFVHPPHTSHVTQPLDVAVFGPFKGMYSRECQAYLQKNPGIKITKYEIARLVSDPYLRAMSPPNLVSAFWKTGIYPLPKDSIYSSELAPSTIYQDKDGHHESEIPQDSGPMDTEVEEPETAPTVHPASPNQGTEAAPPNQETEAVQPAPPTEETETTVTVQSATTGINQ